MTTITLLELNNFTKPKFCCSDCNNWQNGCKLGYRVFANSKPCRQGIKRQSNLQKRKQSHSTVLFSPVDELDWYSSGKTAKMYFFENGKQRFIGQVTYSGLRELIEGQNWKVGICKYQKASSDGNCLGATTQRVNENLLHTYMLQTDVCTLKQLSKNNPFTQTGGYDARDHKTAY
ncbi:MAG: hypothetical protein FWC33_02020 [Candidatus Bathyarchaeota archaeon]|nr:hypothetical protein [Candidatus Termiticorpusculum sp.]